MIFIANEDVEVLSAFAAETELRVLITVGGMCITTEYNTFVSLKQKLKYTIAVGEQQNIAQYKMFDINKMFDYIFKWYRWQSSIW